MNRLKVWPHLAVIALLCLLLGVGAAIWLVGNEGTVQASALPNAARIDRVNGEVGLNKGLEANSNAAAQWVDADQNTPISVGDRIYTKDNADASVDFTGRNFARLNENSSMDVLTLSDKKTQLALRNGSAVFDISSLDSNALFEVATPCGAVDLIEPGLYQVEINEEGNATATALSGAAQVVGQSGTGRIEKGEVLTVPCGGSAQATLSRAEPRAAGTLVDHYYSYRYPRTYDGRYANYDSYLSDPFYYDPYRRFESYQYVSDYIPGVDDLDYYGNWQDVGDYGYCWSPRVDAGWAPYQSGYWTTDYPYGLTWVSNEPWGYAPYHYGRWTFVGSRWFWVPDRVRTRPAYSPALVAFVPLQAETIGWVALAPGDPYAPRYYDNNWRPRYLDRTRIIQDRVINLNVPGAVTVVNVRNFDRVIERRSIEQVDVHQFGNVHPVLDPFAVKNFREVALRARGNGHRFDVSTAVAERIDRPVITSTTPSTPVRADLAQRFHVRPVAEKIRGERLQLRDERQAVTQDVRPSQDTQPAQSIAAEQARERQMANLARQAARENRDGRRQMLQLERQGRSAPQLSGKPAAESRTQREEQQQNTLRNIQRQPPQPQAQPRERQRYLGPPVKVPENRAVPPKPQAAPHPQPMKPTKPMNPRPPVNVERRPQPQAPQLRQQPQPRTPAPQMRQQAQPQPKAQKPEVMNERRLPARPPTAPATTHPENKKGRGKP